MGLALAGIPLLFMVQWKISGIPAYFQRLSGIVATCTSLSSEQDLPSPDRVRHCTIMYFVIYGRPDSFQSCRAFSLCFGTLSSLARVPAARPTLWPFPPTTTSRLTEIFPINTWFEGTPISPASLAPPRLRER